MSANTAVIWTQFQRRIFLGGLIIYLMYLVSSGKNIYVQNTESVFLDKEALFLETIKKWKDLILGASSGLALRSTAPPTPIFPAALASPPPVSPAYLPTASLVCTLSFKRTRPFLLWPL